VGLPDGSKYCFDYDGSYGVIKQIHYYAPDDQPNAVRHERRRTTYAINFTNTDSPRVTQERDWAEQWNGDTDGAWASNEEAVTQFGNTTAPPPTFNGYTYRRNLSIDHTKVPNTDQSNFPVLVSGTYSYLKTTANGGSVQNANGYDVIFTSDSSCATKLNHETETYNASTGAVNYWVRVPTVSHTSDTTFYMCYGNSSVTADQSNKWGVWDSNFQNVYHLPNGTTLSANDSTANAVNGTIENATAAAGQMAGGASFNGSSAGINLGNTSTWAMGSGDYTFEAWIKVTSNPVWVQSILHKDAVGERQVALLFDNLFAANCIDLIHFNDDGTFYWRQTPANSLTTNAWHHVAGARNGSSLLVYIDGVSQTLSSAYTNGPLGTMKSAASVAYIGRNAYSGYEEYFNGLIGVARGYSVLWDAGGGMGASRPEQHQFSHE